MRLQPEAGGGSLRLTSRGRDGTDRMIAHDGDLPVAATEANADAPITQQCQWTLSSITATVNAPGVAGESPWDGGRSRRRFPVRVVARRPEIREA